MANQLYVIPLLRIIFFFFPGCARDWDGLSCWPRAAVGEIVKIPCPRFFEEITNIHGKTFFIFLLSLHALKINSSTYRFSNFHVFMIHKAIQCQPTQGNDAHTHLGLWWIFNTFLFRVQY